ncbi:hypothetical protein [Marinobacterium rhizophilum]|uniref:2OG-Fe(II) oxygenase n=1 Tax=Marinobacterium rhizophilum TaxID=420402 RepID=A0ABY5HM39_9GAMM|nr:hypothetical protein [Marinobacterium rhizophilum]UTW12877.1 hypothetical protein KDW95_04155 [Marinobacterium rhizophilum]
MRRPAALLARNRITRALGVLRNTVLTHSKEGSGLVIKVSNRVLFHSSRLAVNLVNYPSGHRVMRHVDPVPGKRYYKLNFVLVKPASGGVFECENCILNLFGRVYLFRPDLHEHSVSPIESGRRLLLSFALSL